MSTITGSTYLGLPVLDGATGLGPVEDTGSRDVTTAIGPGPIRQDAHEATPRYRRVLLVQCMSALEVADLFAFVEDRRGRLLPFWLPSWDRDLALAVAYASGAAALRVLPARYSELSWPASPARRYLQVRGPSGTVYRRKVTVAEDADPEVLTLSSSIAEDIPAGTGVAFLRYCRLDEDAPKVTFFGADTYAECEVAVIEVPQECPE